MASNLAEYYQAQGQALPSVNDRQGIATKAGISNYTGTKDQNTSLLGYLQSTPTQGSNNVITADGLKTETPIKLPQPKPDTQFAGTSATVSSLLDTTKGSIKTDEANLATQTSDLENLIKSSGDQTAINEAIYAKQGVDSLLKSKNTFTSQIEQEQKSAMDQIEAIRTSPNGLTGGAQAEIGRIQRDSANKLANYGIGLAAVSRDYESASNIATRQITANSDRIKSDIEAKKFVLDQLGTKLATEKSNAFTLQLKQLDKEDDLLKTAIKTATDGASDGSIDGNTAFKAVQDLTSGKISLSQFYTELGVQDNTGIINGYDITSYATDPTHEQKVISIYNTIGDITSEADAVSTIKSLTPNSPVTGKMVLDSAAKYNVDPKLIISIMQQDSSMGTKGLGAKTKNPGNVGNDDSGKTQTFNSWNEGVDAVAKWLSGHRAKNLYRGEFAGTLETVTGATNEPDKTKKQNLANMQKYVANGDYNTAYKQIENTVSKILTGDNKTQYDAKRIAIPAVEDLKTKLQAYTDAGGKTNLLKGKFEDIAAKLGEVSDPKYKALATDLKISLQKYRHDMSGAAFSAQEAADYASVNPSGTNSLNLNLSIIDGMLSNFKTQVDSTVDTYAGDGAQYIREYARTGTNPKTAQAKPVYQSTPAGNSFTIIQ